MFCGGFFAVKGAISLNPTNQIHDHGFALLHESIE
jgi:hypothetical protein